MATLSGDRTTAADGARSDRNGTAARKGRPDISLTKASERRNPVAPPPPVGPTFATRLDPRKNSLNAIRLALACLVIFSHSWILGGGIWGSTGKFAGETAGGWAVFAFFALSGYLVTGSRLSTSFTDYIKRRVLRIYPGYFVCLLSTVLICGPIAYFQEHHTLNRYFSTNTTPVDYLLQNLTMHGTTYHVAGTPNNPHEWTGSLWSLYFEFLCYLMVGFLAFWSAFRRRPAVAVALLAAATLARIELPAIQRYSNDYDFVLLLRLLPYFLAGSVLYLLRDKVPCRWWLAVLAVAAALVVLEVGGNRFVCLCALPMGYLLLYLGAVVPVTIGRRNDISYGLYMYGYPVEQLLHLFFRIPSQALFTGLAIVGTVPVAAASWFFVERPASRFGRLR